MTEATEIKALILNLRAEKRRLDFQAQQLKNLGIEYSRINAITSETLTPAANDKYWYRWERPLRTTEMALLLTHRLAWEKIADDTVPWLVLEDDAVLLPRLSVFLRRARTLSSIDHISLEVRKRKKLVGRSPHPQLPIVRLWQDRTGAAAYLLWPSGARLLLKRSRQRPGLSDAVISSAYEMRSWQAFPALAVQFDCCAYYGIEEPFPTTSTIGSIPKPTARGMQNLGFRARRILAQLRMGMRQASCLAVASRRYVPLASDDLAEPKIPQPS